VRWLLEGILDGIDLGFEADGAADEQRAVINVEKLCGIVIPRAIQSPSIVPMRINRLLMARGGMDFRSETLKLGRTPNLNEGEIRHHFVNRLGDAE